MVVGNLQFYREESLKRVEINGFRFEIPREWEVIKLIDAADYINGYAFSSKDWKDEGLPIIRIQNLNDPEAEFNYFDGEIDNRYIVENGDLLFSWSASISVYIWKRGKAILNQHIFKVVPKNNINKFYLYYALFLAIEQLKNRVHGSTMKHFKRGELKTAFIPLPPLSEQQKIARVLMSIDKAIEAVDKAIAKAERIKKSLMQELLTKGIGHKEFKDKEIGRIPKEWKVVRFEEITNKIIDSPHKIPKKSDQGVPFVSVNYMIKFPDRNFYIDENKNGLEYISDDDLQDFVKRFNPEKGDILYSKWGTPGVAKLINTEKKFIGSCSVALIKPRVDRIDSLFLVYTLNSNIIRRQIVPHSKTSTRTEIHIGHIKKLKIPLPPLPEQQKIAQILSKWDELIELKKAKKEKLERMKKKVMKLLLTGKLRVK